MAGNYEKAVREILERLPPEAKARMRGSVSSIRIEHDDWCLLLNGGRSCTCDPNVRMFKRPTRRRKNDRST